MKKKGQKRGYLSTDSDLNPPAGAIVVSERGTCFRSPSGVPDLTPNTGDCCEAKAVSVETQRREAPVVPSCSLVFVPCRVRENHGADSPRAQVGSKVRTGEGQINHTRSNFFLSTTVTYLSHVPIAIFLRYLLGHLGSPGYPDRPVVGVNPSFARRGRQAETERQDAKKAPSPGGVVDHLLLLFTRLFFFSSSSSSSSSADQANNQTSLLAKKDAHRNTIIRAKNKKNLKK